MIWWCRTIPGYGNSPQGLFVSLQFPGTVLVFWLNWYDVKCQFTNPRQKQWDSGRYARVWANWTNPRNWANSPAIQQLLSGNWPTQAAGKQWMNLSDLWNQSGPKLNPGHTEKGLRCWDFEILTDVILSTRENEKSSANIFLFWKAAHAVTI